MIRVSFNDDELRAALAKAKGRLANMRPLFAAIGEALAENTKRRFASSTAPDGSPWEPNRPSTIENYLRKFRSSRTKAGKLSAAGARRAASKKPLIGETRTLSTTINYIPDARGVSVGPSSATNKYAPTQQFGRGYIPARPFLGVSAADRAAIIDAVEDYVEASFD